MDEFNRRVPLNQRGNIDGITPRRPNSEPISVATPRPVNPAQQQTAQTQNPAKQAANKPAAGPGEVKHKPPIQKIVRNKRKKTRNLLAITFAVIVFAGLSALAVYVQSNKDDSAKNAKKSSQTQEDNAGLINQTVGEIDKLDNQPDKSGEGLSDDKLGL